MRHVARTHRVDLYVGTKEQIADMFTKGSFTIEQWSKLCRLAQIGDANDLTTR